MSTLTEKYMYSARSAIVHRGHDCSRLVLIVPYMPVNSLRQTEFYYVSFVIDGEVVIKRELMWRSSLNGS